MTEAEEACRLMLAAFAAYGAVLSDLFGHDEQFSRAHEAMEKVVTGPREEKATIVCVSGLSGGTATADFTRDDGTSGRMGVFAEGWSDCPPNQWPPRPGDRIWIIQKRPIAVLTSRKS